MAYARFSDESDVYVFVHSDRYICCCMCRLNNNKDVKLLNTKIAIEHLKVHVDRGHLVPEYLFIKLAQDRKENDAWIKKMNKAQG